MMPHEPDPPHSAVPPRWQTFSHAALVVVFLCLIGLPLVGQVTGIGATESLAENRQSAAFPNLEWRLIGPFPWPRRSSVMRFPPRFEAYYNDCFGFRRALIRCYNLAVVHEIMPGMMASNAGKPRPENPALVGKNGWLYCTLDEDIEAYRCARPFTPPQLENWKRVLQERRDWLAQRGIRYLFVVPPSKPAVYPEHLPRAIQRVGNTTRVEQLAATLEQASDAELLLNLRPELLRQKALYPQYPCFYRTDTHWNTFGGFCGYRGLMQRLQPWFPQIEPRSLEEFRVQVDEGEPMLLATLLDTTELFTDTHVVLHPRQARHSKTVQSSPLANAKIDHSLFENPTAPAGRAVVLHDSFMLNIQPFFNEHWQQVYYFWTREFPYEKIEQLRPDIVIQEMAEVLLTTHTPTNPSGMQVPSEREQWARRPDPPR